MKSHNPPFYSNYANTHNLRPLKYVVMAILILHLQRVEMRSMLEQKCFFFFMFSVVRTKS